MKILLSLALAAGFLVSGCCPECPAQQVPDYPVPFCRLARDPGSQSDYRYCCSATLVDRNETAGLIVTANHCTGQGTYKVRFTNGKEHVGRLIDQDTQHDLAAIIVSRPQVAPILCGAFTAQGIYRAYGFGGNGQFSCVEGEVVKTYGSIGSTEHSFVGIAGEPIGGDSGAGTVNDKGEFCGVLWGRSGSVGLITMGRPVSDFLRRLVAEGKWRPSATLTPGGVPIGQRNSRDAYGYSADGTTRTIVDSEGNELEVQLTGLRSRQTLCCPPPRTIIRYITAGCPPGGGGGRRPIEDPIEIAPNATVNVGPLAFRGDIALIVFAIGAGLVAVFLRYFRSYT